MTNDKKHHDPITEAKIDTMCKLHVLLMTMLSAQEHSFINDLLDSTSPHDTTLKMKTMKANLEAIGVMMLRIQNLFFPDDEVTFEELSARLDAELQKFKDQASKMAEIDDDIQSMMKS